MTAPGPRYEGSPPASVKASMIEPEPGKPAEAVVVSRDSTAGRLPQAWQVISSAGLHMASARLVIGCHLRPAPYYSPPTFRPRQPSRTDAGQRTRGPSWESARAGQLGPSSAIPPRYPLDDHG